MAHGDAGCRMRSRPYRDRGGDREHPPRLIGLTLAAAGASTAQASFWTLPASFLGGAAAAAGIALVNSLGNLAGFTSTYLVGWMADLSNATSLYLFGGIVFLGAILVLLISPSLVNK